MRSALHATTPFPNALLDEVMPILKDTEWRLLCVIVRQTLGWQNQRSTHRKERDWLTREQLKARTGRDSEALSKAVDALIRKNYILAETEAGKLLETPIARRSYRAKIYYRLGSRLNCGTPRHNGDLSVIELSKIELNTPDPCSILPDTTRQSEHENAAKANGTKEKQTKETETKAKRTKQVFSFPENQTRNTHTLGTSGVVDGVGIGDSKLDVVAAQLFEEKSDALIPEPKSNGIDQQAFIIGKPLLESTVESAELSETSKAFLVLFTSTAKEKLGKAVNLQLSPQDRTRLEKLLKKHQGLEWKAALELFFECDLGHVTRRGYSLPAFLDSCNLFLLRVSGSVHRMQSTSWRKPLN